MKEARFKSSSIHQKEACRACLWKRSLPFAQITRRFRRLHGMKQCLHGGENSISWAYKSIHRLRHSLASANFSLSWKYLQLQLNLVEHLIAIQKVAGSNPVSCSMWPQFSWFRTSGCGPEGHGFKSHRSPQSIFWTKAYKSVAQIFI